MAAVRAAREDLFDWKENKILLEHISGWIIVECLARWIVTFFPLEDDLRLLELPPQMSPEASLEAM